MAHSVKHIKGPVRRAGSWLALWSVLAPVLLAVGCSTTVSPDYKAPEPEQPADFTQWHGGAAELLPMRPTSNAPIPDWSHLHDPVLSRLLTDALQSNSDVQTSALRLAQSRALRQSTAASELPQVNASASVSRSRASEGGDSTRMVTMLVPPAQQPQALAALASPYESDQVGLDFSWELDLWGRVKRSVEAADAQIATSQALLSQVRWSVQAEVARRYFQLRGAQRQLALTRSDIADLKETLKLMRARAVGGLTSDLDVTRQRGLLAQLQALEPQLLVQAANATNALTMLLAKPPGALKVLLAVNQNEDFFESADTWPDLSLGLASDVARRRPDIIAAEAQLHAATANTGVAIADFYPRFTLGARFGFQTLGLSNFGDWGNRTWSIGPSLQLPIFDNGRRTATLTVRRLQQQEAAIAYHQTVLQAWHEIDNALNAYSAERMRNVHLVERERSSRDALMLAEASYENGLTNFLSQLDAQRALIAAQRDRAASDIELGQNWVLVLKALGPKS